MYCLSTINPYQTTEKTKDIHAVLFAGQCLVPVLGMLPAAIQIIFSLGQWLVSWMTSEGQEHREIATKVLFMSGKNFASLGFYIPYLFYCTDMK